jgi:hypothetical protein
MPIGPLGHLLSIAWLVRDVAGRQGQQRGYDGDEEDKTKSGYFA